MKAAKNRALSRTITTLFTALILWCIPNFSQAQSAIVGDFVWQDLNQNGLQDIGEPGLGNLQIEIYDCMDLDNPVQTVSSMNNGLYAFSNLPAGNYRVRFGSANGFNPTFENVGNDDTIDSDAGLDGWTECFELEEGQTLIDIDAGFQVCDPNASLTCNNQVNISLDPSGIAIVTPDDLLEGDNICTSLFEIDIEWQGQSIGDTLTCDQVGFIVTATITDLTNWNFCEVLIEVNDELEPTIVDVPTLTVECNESTDPAVIGGISAIDNCSDVSLVYSDSTADGTCQDTFVERIFRTWVAEDDEGNQEIAVQEVIVLRADLEEVLFPDDVELDGCGNVNTDPSVTGQPTLFGQPVSNGGLCGFQVFSTDQVNGGSCEGETTILRQWTVLDDCSNEIETHNQVITIADNGLPNITCPAPISVGTNSNTCAANILMPAATVSDNCSGSGSIDVVIETPFGDVNGNGGLLQNIPVGNFTATYIATDDCGNSASCTVSVTVADNTPPVPICDQNTVVSLNSDGEATVCWPTFDDGSYDNCQVLAIKVKRADAPAFVPFTDCVDFDCSDIGGTVMVRMRVYDIIGNFTEADPLGRFNECMVNVTVGDNIDPVLACPPDVTLDCMEDYETIPELVSNPGGGAPTFQNGQLIGYYPGAMDNCGIDKVEVVQSGSIDNCGEGTFFRIFTAFDEAGNTSSCSQKITLQISSPYFITDINCSNANPFDGVEWPCDYVTSTCGPAGLDPSVTGEPQITNDGCGLIGVDFEDNYFPIQEPGCIKIIRQWIIIDWCQPDNNEPLGYKNWTYNQEIKVINSSAPEFVSGCEDVTIDSEEPGCNGGPATIVVQADDDCTDISELDYTYKIDLFNDGVGANQGFEYTDQSNPAAFPINADNEASGYYPLGTHRIEWKVEDGCGNFATCEYTFTIRDGLKPKPVAFDELAVDINPADGMVTVFAEAFNSASTDNCTDADDLDFSFSSNPNNGSLTFTCDDLGEVDVRFYVTDEAGNQDFVEVVILVQDNNGVCPGTSTAQVTGLITTPMDDPVQGVDVNLMQNNNMLFSQASGTAGGFAFNAPLGNNYSLVPHKSEDYLNGVSTFDLVLLAQHILKVQPLDSPYKIIAGDANGDGKVSTFDVLELRKLILKTQAELPNTESWRFVDKNYVFPNPEDPFFPPFPELIDINELSVDEIYNDFVAVKVGDLTGDVQANQFTGGTVDVRADNPFVVQAQNADFEAGEPVGLALRAEQTKDLFGFQFTLRFDPEALQFEDLLPSVLDEHNFGYTHLEDGLLLVSYDGQELRGSEELFQLEFTARKAGRLSDFLELNSAQLVAEAYRLPQSGEWSRHQVNLRFENEPALSTGGHTALYQNQPNPFREYTQISFYLAEAADARLLIHDGSGRLLKEVAGKYAAGFHLIDLQKEEVDATGVLFYTLETDNFRETKKMVVIE